MDTITKEAITRLLRQIRNADTGAKAYQVYLKIKPIVLGSAQYQDLATEFKKVFIVPDDWGPDSDDINRITSILKEIRSRISGESGTLIHQPITKSRKTAKRKKNQVFIVHGHDNDMMQAVARHVESHGAEAVIFHERANRGRTIMQKVKEEGHEASAAVILYSADDMGRSKSESELNPRARQNVVLEHGYFLSALGVDRVIALVRATSPKIEMPSDSHGMLYIDYDNHEGWKAKLDRELRTIGLI